MSTSTMSVDKRARRVAREAEPEVTRAVLDGRMNLGEAELIMLYPPERQRELAAGSRDEVAAAVEAKQRAIEGGEAVLAEMRRELDAERRIERWCASLERLVAEYRKLRAVGELRDRAQAAMRAAADRVLDA